MSYLSQQVRVGALFEMRARLFHLGFLSVVSASLASPSAGQITGTTLPNFDKPWERTDYFKPPSKVLPQRLKYGTKHWQRIDFFRVKKGAPAPLVIVLGGVISDWARYRMNSEGYAIAFVSVMPDPNAKASEKMSSYVEAIAYLRGRGAELNIDINRIALHGPGPAANSAFLLGTDPSWLESAGVPFNSLRAVTIGNGSGFDIPKRISESNLRKLRYKKDFGKDLTEQLRMSPITHLAPPNAPGFLILVSADAFDVRAESDEMAAAAMKAGLDVQVFEIPKVLENSRKTYFLAEPDGSGKEYIPFLRDKFGEATD